MAGTSLCDFTVVPQFVDIWFGNSCRIKVWGLGNFERVQHLAAGYKMQKGKNTTIKVGSKPNFAVSFCESLELVQPSAEVGATKQKGEFKHMSKKAAFQFVLSTAKCEKSILVPQCSLVHTFKIPSLTQFSFDTLTIESAVLQFKLHHPRKRNCAAARMFGTSKYSCDHSNTSVTCT